MPVFGQERFAHQAHEWSAGLGYAYGDRETSLVDNRPLYGPHLVPENMYEAMMVADFGQEPAMSSDEREADWLLFETRINNAGLSDREKVVVDCVVFGQMSLAKTGEYLARHDGVNKARSRQHVHAVRNRAFAKLRKALTDDMD